MFCSASPSEHELLELIDHVEKSVQTNPLGLDLWAGLSRTAAAVEEQPIELSLASTRNELDISRQDGQRIHFSITL